MNELPQIIDRIIRNSHFLLRFFIIGALRSQNSLIIFQETGLLVVLFSIQIEINTMKNLYRSLSVIVLVFCLVSCKNTAEPEVKTVDIAVSENPTESNNNASYAKVEFNIKGMTCAMGCAKTIEKKMAQMDGVKMAKVDFEKELAMVEYDEAKVTPKTLEETVTKVSEAYKVEDIKTVEQFSTDK